MRRALKAQMSYTRGVRRKQLAAEVQNFSSRAWTLMHALATRHGGAPNGANTFHLSEAAAKNLGVDPGAKSLRFYSALVAVLTLTLSYNPSNKTLRLTGHYVI